MANTLPHEFWAYIITTPEDTGIMYGETAAGHRIPMIAETASKAAALRPIVERLAQISPGRVTLARYAATGDTEEICDSSAARPNPNGQSPTRRSGGRR